MWQSSAPPDSALPPRPPALCPAPGDHLPAKPLGPQRVDKRRRPRLSPGCSGAVGASSARPATRRLALPGARPASRGVRGRAEPPGSDPRRRPRGRAEAKLRGPSNPPGPGLGQLEPSEPAEGTPRGRRGIVQRRGAGPLPASVRTLQICVAGRGVTGWMDYTG